ncbi:MAG: SDR family oxidoreductase [Bacteroidetes bacterium]|nr:SDR family oxidoreductase [Bacteroidota bacterium]MBT5528245.1 SDR family oxidoreductase [Cytophagia bacterium]MBT3423970.1 SDR family oxidoreductase [Bacteroidota bacterium]MBT3932873.1 SDR family oxidoreductase [Bacteroidota bacterium]MBT4339162.1 SDR family oxidoreductase [Bacteroidota bacterium]
MNQMKKIYITGGAGYVGARLVPKLLSQGYEVSVIDLMIYGEDVLEDHPKLTKIKGDIRDQQLLRSTIKGHDAVIHLACISNDPSFELNPDLGKSINLDSFEPLVQISKEVGVNRFIYASSSSVYGIKDVPNVNEDVELDPLTDYSKFKAACEKILHAYNSDDFTVVTIRPATVCGYSRRLRLDLTVNILTNLAVNKGQITVFGGDQKRPNIHIEDITDLYIQLLGLPKNQIAQKIYNAGYENHTVAEIADMVKNVVGDQVDIITTPSDDHRSYHISSEKIKQELGFEPKHSLEDAVNDLKNAFAKGLIPDSLENDRYFNVKRMQNIELK